jgi:hypothetical protein
MNDDKQATNRARSTMIWSVRSTSPLAHSRPRSRSERPMHVPTSEYACVDGPALRLQAFQPFEICT